VAGGVRLGEAALVLKVRPKEAPLCFPKGECELGEVLEERGVEWVYNFGPRDLMGFKVLGAGFRGVVFLAEWKGRKVALKVRRTDVNVDMTREAELQRYAWPIAPKVFDYDRDFIIMEYVPLPSIENVLDALDVEELREVVLKVLSAGRELDKKGIDHGELTRPWKHVLVGDEVKIIDYGSASKARRPSNVTSLVSGLLLKPSPPASLISEKLGINKTLLLEAVRKYKRRMDEESFQNLVSLIL